MQSSRRAVLVLVAGLLFAGTCAFAAEGDFQRTLQVSGLVNLDVQTGSGSIQVHTGNSGQVQITGHIKTTEWFGGNGEDKIKRLQANPPIQQSGNSIRVGQINDSDLRRNVSISYELVVPADTQLHSRTGSGNQTIDGIKGTVEASAGSGGVKVINVGSSARAETGSGNVELQNIRGDVRARAGSGSIHAVGIAGGFEASTGSGHISLEQTAPGAVRVETGSGGIDVAGLHGSFDARAGSGAIRADGEPSGSWTVRSGSGGVRLRVPTNASFDLDARTSSGSISVNHPVTMQGALAKKHVQGKVGSGGVPVMVDTGSGNIEIE